VLYFVRVPHAVHQRGNWQNEVSDFCCDSIARIEGYSASSGILDENNAPGGFHSFDAQCPIGPCATQNHSNAVTMLIGQGSEKNGSIGARVREVPRREPRIFHHRKFAIHGPEESHKCS